MTEEKTKWCKKNNISTKDDLKKYFAKMKKCKDMKKCKGFFKKMMGGKCKKW